MSEVRIKYGLDQFGHRIPIEGAIHQSYRYRCPMCEKPFTVRMGDIRVKHFAHISSLDEEKCPLRSPVNHKELEKKIKISPIEIDEKNRKLRLIIRKYQYINKYELCALLPTSKPEDFALYNSDERASIINSIYADGECIKNSPVPPNFFDPREPEAKIPLYVVNNHFEINVNASQNIPSIYGKWTAPCLHQYDIFIGDAFIAERVSKLSGFNKGDLAYIVLDRELTDIPPEFNIQEMDSYKLLVFDLNKSMIKKIKNILPDLTIKIDDYAFDVDVILPPESRPNSNAPILGKPKTKALISIVPPPDLDPSFELISIPYDEKKDIPILNTGVGQPRYYETLFLSNGSKRLSIHWGSRHKYLNFHTKNNLTDEKDLLKKNINIGIKINNTSDLYVPWINPLENIIEINRKKNMEDDLGFDFVGPKGISFDIEGRSNEYELLGRYYDISMEQASFYIKDWFDNELIFLNLYYGPLGIIKINYITNYKKKLIMTDEEIITKIRELPTLPKKSSKKTVRIILNLDNSRDIPSGAKKRIRQILLRLRKEIKKSEGK